MVAKTETNFPEELISQELSTIVKHDSYYPSKQNQKKSNLSKKKKSLLPYILAGTLALGLGSSIMVGYLGYILRNNKIANETPKYLAAEDIEGDRPFGIGQ